MHVAYARDTNAQGGGGAFRASFPPPRTLEADAPAVPASRYGEGRRPSFRCVAAVIGFHVVALVALVQAEVIAVHKKPPPPLVVDLIATPPVPPPPPAAPQPEVKQVQPVQTPLVAPPPLVATPTPPPPVAIVAETPPPQAVVVAPVAKAAGVSAPISVDLATKLISAKPPRYPVESRRRHEEGTVVLWVRLAIDGTVADLGVGKTSGFERLDQAALEAVKRWRWAPTLVGGQPVEVRGTLPFPFVLQG